MALDKDWAREMSRIAAEMQGKRLVKYLCVPCYNGHPLPMTVTALEVTAWSKGLNMPNIIDRFERWWAATLIRHKLITKFYMIEKEQLTPWRALGNLINNDLPLYKDDRQFVFDHRRIMFGSA